MDNNNPTVYTTYTAGENPIKNKPWFKTWRIVYALFGIVLIVELVLGAKTLLSPIPKTTTRSLQPLSGGSISLLSDKLSYKLGETVSVKINVWTGGYNSSGTDIVLNYNPKVLQASPSGFIRGKIYSDYPKVSVDVIKGVIRISGVAASAKQAFSGAGEFGIFKFKARTKGTTDLTIDFKNGQTEDSNIMILSTNEDNLQKVKNLKLNIE